MKSKTKRLSANGIAVVALSVLLAVSVSVSATLAWFASQDTASGTLVLGQPVVVTVTDIGGSDTEALTMQIASENLLPGMQIVPDVAVSLAPSTTATIMRARLDTTVDGGADATALNTAFRGVLTTAISGGWVLNADDGWYYYLGAAGADARVMNTTAEGSDLVAPEFGATTAKYDTAVTINREWDETALNTGLASVVSGSTAKTLPFLTTSFRLPTSITNEYANATINLSFIVEALQDYLVIEDVNVITNLQNAKTIFDSISTYVAG